MVLMGDIRGGEEGQGRRHGGGGSSRVREKEEKSCLGMRFSREEGDNVVEKELSRPNIFYLF